MQSQNPYWGLSRDESRTKIFRTLKTRFAATKTHTGDSHTARHAVDALSDSGKPLSLPPPDTGRMGWVLIDYPFAPCTTGLDDLQPVMLKDLVMGSHHRGKFLLVELVSVISTSSVDTIAGIKDGAGDVERLKINTVCMNSHNEHKWQQAGHWYIVKEPFLTLDEKQETDNPCLRVDHPSDLVDAHRLPEHLLRLKSLNNVLVAVGERTVHLCRESGDLAFRAGDLSASHDSYTEGLQIANDQLEEELTTQDLYRKRAYVRLNLGRYEGAVADALASVSCASDDKSKQLEAQAYSCAADACYKLKHFARTSKFLLKQLELSPGSTKAQRLLKRTKARLGEQEHGIYDVKAIKSALTTQPRVDAADYHVNTILKASAPGRGRGLFAARDFHHGELILAETAFSSVWAGEEGCSIANKWSVRHPDQLPSLLVGMWKSLVQKVGNNPVDGQQLLDLHGADQTLGTTVNEIDETSVVDTYQVHDIIIRNVFALVSAESAVHEKKGSAGVFVCTSYINHSCLANSNRILLGDFTMIHATKPIAKGEEITICYDGAKVSELPFEERMRDMQMDWEFQCSCNLCVAEARCTASEHTRRNELALKATIGMHTERGLEQFVRDIAATYGGQQYSQLPLMATIPTHVALIISHLKDPDNTQKLMQSVLDLLRAVGYHVDEQNGNIHRIVPTTNTFVWGDIDIVRKPLINQAIKAFLSRDFETADHLFTFAASVERICSGGETETFEERSRYFG